MHWIVKSLNSFQRQAYYEAKRTYGEALDNLAAQEENKDEFVASLLETIREHPELLDEMRTGLFKNYANLHVPSSMVLYFGYQFVQ